MKNTTHLQNLIDKVMKSSTQRINYSTQIIIIAIITIIILKYYHKLIITLKNSAPQIKISLTTTKNKIITFKI